MVLTNALRSAVVALSLVACALGGQRPANAVCTDDICVSGYCSPGMIFVDCDFNSLETWEENE